MNSLSVSNLILNLVLKLFCILYIMLDQRTWLGNSYFKTVHVVSFAYVLINVVGTTCGGCGRDRRERDEQSEAEYTHDVLHGHLSI